MKPGNPNNYPFDWYDANIDMVALTPEINNTILFTAEIQGAVQGFTYTTQFQASGGSELLIGINIRRSTTTKIFAFIVFLRECAR